MNNSDDVYEEQVSESPTEQPESQAEHPDLNEDPGWQEPAVTRTAAANDSLPWLQADEIDELQSRWNQIQIEFVDDPGATVKQADALVAEAVDRIQQAFTTQRNMVNGQWANQQDISTEDLRIVLQGYRSFLNRLLAP